MSPSPKKKTVKKKKAITAFAKRQLTIEYSGICALMWWHNRKTGGDRADVWLVDVGATGREPHFGSLMTRLTSTLKSPESQAVTTLPGFDDEELGLWNLTGCTVTVTSDVTSPLTLEHTALSDGDLGGLPPSTPATQRNLAWLADIANLTGSDTVKTAPPVSARVENLFGTVTGGFSSIAKGYEFTFSTPKGTFGVKDRVVLARFKQEIPFDKWIMLTIVDPVYGTRQLRFEEPKDFNTDVVISNLCQCPDEGPGDHFYAYYDLLKSPAQRPEIKSVKRTGVNPLVDPEHCIDAIVRLEE